MSILKVARLGHPVLRQKAQDIPVEEISSDWIQRLIEDMIETLYEYDGIGLAAPQVHESIQLAIIEIPDESPRYPNAPNNPLTIFINPKITILDEKKHGYWEGCLSVPELRGYVERPRKVKVDFYNRRGLSETMEFEGFLSTVVQHELDHLDGTLYVDKIHDPIRFAFIEEFQRYHTESIEE